MNNNNKLRIKEWLDKLYIYAESKGYDSWKFDKIIKSDYTELIRCDREDKFGRYELRDKILINYIRQVEKENNYYFEE